MNATAFRNVRTKWKRQQQDEIEFYPETISTEFEMDLGPADLGGSVETIATEFETKPHPNWATCIDSLLDLWKGKTVLPEPKPNLVAIESALSWMAFLKNECPQSPPTTMVAEPCGGIIFERETGQNSDCVLTREITCYNNGFCEFTIYENGRVVSIDRLPSAAIPKSARD